MQFCQGSAAHTNFSVVWPLSWGSDLGSQAKAWGSLSACAADFFNGDTDPNLATTENIAGFQFECQNVLKIQYPKLCPKTRADYY